MVASIIASSRASNTSRLFGCYRSTTVNIASPAAVVDLVRIAAADVPPFVLVSSAGQANLPEIDARRPAERRSSELERAGLRNGQPTLESSDTNFPYGAVLLMPRYFILCMTFAMGCFFAQAKGADAPVRTMKSPAEWPQWRGPNRDGISPDMGLLQDWDRQLPKLLWTAEGMGGGYASLSVAGGRIYTTGNLPTGQGVVCINAADGKVLWKKPIIPTVPKHGYSGTRCTPSLDGERLYAIATSGKIA